MVQILVPSVTFVLDANQYGRHEGKEHLHWQHCSVSNSESNQLQKSELKAYKIAHAKSVHCLLTIPLIADLSSSLVDNP